MESTNNQHNISNPWKGLNYYTEGEILYGRSEEIQSLFQYIINNTQTVLFGKSGIGKSSIVNAGIFPVARQAGLYPVSIRFEHDISADYASQVRAAFNNSGLDITEIVPAINRQTESLWEFFHRHTFSCNGRMVRPLIVFDQFEEIFTLQKNEAVKKQFFSQLADLINEVMPQYISDWQESQLNQSQTGSGDYTEVFTLDFGNSDIAEYHRTSDFSLVFIIREDFLSYLERYTAYIPSMKSNRYGLQMINEEQAREIIMNPVPGLIDESVAKLIICKLTESKEVDFEFDGTPEMEVDSAVLSLFLSRLFLKKPASEQKISAELVNQYSEDIIKDFYEEATSRIEVSKIRYLEDVLVNKEGRRENISRYNARNIGKLSDNDLKILIYEEKILRQFSYGGDLRLEFIHDILCSVICERKEFRENIERQKEERKRQEKEMSLLARKARINKKRLYYAIGTVAVLLFFLLCSAMAYNWEWSEDYGNFTTVDGWPVGIGEKLSGFTEKEALIVYYRLTRRGWLPESWGGHPFTKVEVLSEKGTPTTNKFLASPVVSLVESELDDQKAAVFANMQKACSYWIYSSSDNSYDYVSRCAAYDIKGKELYSVQYYRDRNSKYREKNESGYIQWAIFNDAEGKQLQVRDNGIDRIRQTIDQGIVTSCSFFSGLGTPQRNGSGTYGYLYETTPDTKQILRQYNIDMFGNRIDSTAVDYYEYRHGRCMSSSVCKTIYSGNGRIVLKYDGYADTLEFDTGNTSLVYMACHPAGFENLKIVSEYDSYGNPVMHSKSENGKLLEHCIYSYSDNIGVVAHKEIFDNGICYDERYSYGDSSVSISFWNGNKKIMRYGKGELNTDLNYHECVRKLFSDSLMRYETADYTDTSGNLVDGEYARSLKVYDKQTNNLRLLYLYDKDDNIYKSNWYEYDNYGNRTARAVAGIDGTPVRCPDWDWDGMTYYKMTYLTVFNYDSEKTEDMNNLIAIRGEDEFGDESYVMMGDYAFYIQETPFKFFFMFEENSVTKGYSVARSRLDMITDAVSVPYLHLLSKEETAYRAEYVSGPDNNVRLADGDVLLNVGTWNLRNGSRALLEKEWSKIKGSGGIVKVLKIIEGKYVPLCFRIEKGEIGAEYHFMPLTESEMKHFKDYIL